MEFSQNITVNRSFNELIPNLMVDFKGFKTSVEEVIKDMVEIERKLE